MKTNIRVLVALLAATILLMGPASAATLLTCTKANSDVALMLYVTNAGSTTVTTGNTIRYEYQTSANGPVIKGTHKLTQDLAPSGFTSILISSAWQTPVYNPKAYVLLRFQPANIRVK